MMLKYFGIGQVVGTPTREEIQAMNQNYTEFKFPQIKAHPWAKVPPVHFFMTLECRVE